MKAESEVSISFAISIFSNEKFTPDDYRLTYKSYEELGLICENCRELVFFKQGIERVSHFSHFKSTGKNCEWRRRTSSNSNTQHTDSESREQSLEKFQNKFKGIIERAIIQYHNISSPQFLSQIVNGKILVAEYNINIEAWLRWFNKKKNRNKVENVALALYQNNELLSNINSRVILNLLDYLCVSASKDILRDILYYVVFVVNKEIGVNNDFEKVCCKVIEIIIFADWKKEYEIAPITFKGIDHPNVEEKTPKGQIKVEQQTPKPIKLENEKVVTGSAKFVDVIGTTPVIMKLNPSTTGYKLTALPVKLPDSFCYDLARYIAGNIPKMSAITYLHKEITRLQALSTEFFGGIPRTDLISMLNNLKEGVIADKKIDPANFITSKNKLREELNKSPFLTSNREQYYGFYELAIVTITQEVEDKEYQYRLTNLSPDDKAFYRHNLPSVLNWVRRVTHNLRSHFNVNKPDTGEIRKYLQSKFDYSNCKLNVYYGEKQPRKGLIMEISHQGQVISEHHIQIIDPANTEKRYTRTNEEGKPEQHDRHYGIIPTKITVTPSFNDHNDDEIFYALLECQKTDRELVTFAKAQLSKVINKYISANRNKLVGENKSAVQVTVAKSVGFIDTGHGYNAIKKTFLKFLRPFTSESAVNMGKVVDLKTLKPYTDHDSTFLLEKMTAGWKTWNKASDRIIELGQQSFRKENPGKLMLNVHNLIQSNPELSSLVWDDLINTFYHLSQLSIGFKSSKGVILTPFDIYSNDLQRWQHRIKIQLISILKDGDKTRTLGIESLLQREIEDLYSTLDRLSPTWNTNQDINKHLAELHDCLSAAKKLNP
ncbi:hypothetical protein QUB10_26690 [Microcoleus sp. B5-D4]|uniref:hypothetical protein n=1 Tax=unclassified Microcoleus TaxID=2642155 RepID=UPI002FCF3D2B